MKIFKTTDELVIKIEDVTIVVSPLNYEHKIEVQNYMLKAVKGDIEAGMVGAKLAMKYSIKRVENVTLADGTPYEVVMENGVLSDETVNDLCNCEIAEKLTTVCCQFLIKVPNEFIDPNTSLPLKGVSYVKNYKRALKK